MRSFTISTQNGSSEMSMCVSTGQTRTKRKLQEKGSGICFINFEKNRSGEMSRCVSLRRVARSGRCGIKIRHFSRNYRAKWFLGNADVRFDWPGSHKMQVSIHFDQKFVLVKCPSAF